MQSKDIKFSNIPDKPGVYFFVKKRRQDNGDRIKRKKKAEITKPNTPNPSPWHEVLYIGKATSLRDRIKSYFSGDLGLARGERVVKMINDATGVEWQATDSVLEALILEANLIKRHKPKANARDKDNKSFNFVIITAEEFPKVLLVRGRELQLNWDPDDIKYQFGPYPHGGELKEALRIIRKIFPFRGAKDPVTKKRARRVSTLNEQIGLTPGFTRGEADKKEYQKTINHLRLFFEGKKGKLIKVLEKEMKKDTKEENFEKAAKIRNQIFALEHIRDVSLLKSKSHTNILQNVSMRVEGYDVAHMSGKDSVGVMVVVENGEPEKNEYRKFKIKEAPRGSDTDALKEVLERRLLHDEWPLPKLFVIDGGKGQKNVAEKVLEEFGIKIPVASVVKDTKHRARQILGDREVMRRNESDILIANSEAHRFAQNYHKNLRRKIIRKNK